MKTLSLVLALLAFATPVYAQNAPIVVLSADGSSSELQVNTRPKFGKNEAITAPREQRRVAEA